MRGWYSKALKLKGKQSYLIVADSKKSDPAKGIWAKREVVLQPPETEGYIKWLKDLVVFAELAAETKSPIYVSA